MKLVTNGFAPLYADEQLKIKIRDCSEGAVGVFNPFMNSIEYYSWREWVASAGYPYGVA